MSFLRSEQDIEVSVRKAISPEETAPKRKHVRACVVYTWDHRNGKAFWHAIRMLPLQSDPVMTFKALIVIHKVLHEGHKSVLREAQNHVDWIRSLSGPGGGYRRLIDEYIRLLLFKLQFHRQHPDFNGTFEYEEYISLRNVDDPNDGYESVIDLMNLQDTIDDYQRLVFASLGAPLRHTSGSGQSSMECRVSSLTAMVTESYGIYRFATSMLRGLHQQADSEVLEPLRARYYSQHRRLRNFYFDCRGVKYLSGLISIPELSVEPPDLMQSNDAAPQLPKRPQEHKTGESLAPSTTGTIGTQTPAPEDAFASQAPLVPEATGTWWANEQPNLAAQQLAEEQHLRQLEETQRQLEAERRQQEMLTMQAQQQFEAEQAALLAQQQAQQAELAEFARQQQQAQQQAQIYDAQAAREQELAILKNQQTEAQNMLEQYDQRVQALESDLAQMSTLSQQQLDAKTEQLEGLQSQCDVWRSKYEALAKLYSQLRHEHLELMAKYRTTQAKAASAQEAIEKREKAERDLKAKNLELADLIRERDRARYELDKTRGLHNDEVEKLERSISLLNDRVSDTDRSRDSDVKNLVGAHNLQVKALESELLEREKQLAQLRIKEDEADILREQIQEMEDIIGAGDANGVANDSNKILDAVLQASNEQVQQSLTAFESPLESGNPNATPGYVLNICDNNIANLETFCDAYTQYIADGPQSIVEIITSASALSGSTHDLLANVKGLAVLVSADPGQNQGQAVLDEGREVAANLCTFYSSLNSELMAGLEEEDDKLELVITNHVEILKHLQELSNTIEGMLPKASVLGAGSLNQQVDGAMAKLAEAVAAANQRLARLLDSAAGYSKYDKSVNNAIISSAGAVTAAIGTLIRASIECQKEIVASGRQGRSPEEYYKKNHRWTEGLISAAKTVGTATNLLIDSADSTLSGQGSPEQLIVSSREVAASIAQLVSASRVKAGYMSSTQQSLESASKSVTHLCRELVTKVEGIIAKSRPDAKSIDYEQLSPMDFKSASLEQQVEVLKLEQNLVLARNRLFEIRKLEYARQEDE